VVLTQRDLLAYWNPMVRVARGVLGSQQDAEECAGEAIAQVLERQPEGVENLEAFLVTVAKRRAVDRLRTVMRERRRDTQLAVQAEAQFCDPAEQVVDRAAAAWLSAEAQRRLSPQSMRILRATSDGEDLRTIAAREGLTFRAAESDLFRSRRLLRGVWARALAGLAAAWAGVRRALLPAAPAAVAAAALLMLLPAFLTAPSPAEPRSQEPSPTGPPLAARTQETVSPDRRPSAPAPTPERTTTAGTSPVLLREGDPAGSTIVQKDRHGSGPDAGLVGGAIECLTNLTLDPHHLGC